MHVCYYWKVQTLQCALIPSFSVTLLLLTYLPYGSTLVFAVFHWCLPVCLSLSAKCSGQCSTGKSGLLVTMAWPWTTLKMDFDMYNFSVHLTIWIKFCLTKMTEFDYVGYFVQREQILSYLALGCIDLVLWLKPTKVSSIWKQLESLVRLKLSSSLTLALPGGHDYTLSR